MFAFGGPRALDGTYGVRLIKGDLQVEGEVELVADPRTPHTAEDRRLARETSIVLYDLLEDLAYALETANGLRDSARARAAATEDGGVRRRLEAYADELEAFRADLVSPSETFGGEEKLRERLGNLFGAVSRYDGRPTEPQLRRTDAMRAEMDGVRTRFDGLTGARLGELNAFLEGRGLEPLAFASREEWEAAGG